MSPVSPFSGRDYAYGYGRVGVLQEYLLTQGDVERLLGASDEQSLMRALTELKMSKSIEWTADPHRYIDALEQWLQREVTEMAPPDQRHVFDILWLKSDASLLAYLLKRHHGYTSSISTEPVVGATAYEPDLLRTLVRDGRSAEAPEDLSAFVVRMRETTSLSPQQIDTMVAQYVADQQVRLAAKSGSREIVRYVAHHIDLQNIRTARRLSSKDNPTDHLLTGGEIPIEAFTAEPERLAELVRKSSLPNSLIEALLDADDSSVMLERGLAKAIAHDIAVMRDHVLTIEPIFAFAAIAQSQLRVLRTLIIGKSTGLSVEEIKKLLPPFLSASPFAS